MALQENVQTFTYVSGAAVGQYRFVMAAGAKWHAVQATAAGLAVGVTLNKATAAEQALTVGAGGIVKIEANVAINVGDQIAVAANGRGTNVGATGATVMGIAVSAAGGAGEIFEMHFFGPWAKV
jgi:hypothetical protein